MITKTKEDFLYYLLDNVTENKKNKLLEVSANRTEHLTVVLENISESKDATGVIRTCECFGINSVYVIENSTRYRVNPAVSMGSFKWININRFNIKGQNNTPECLSLLKQKGYKIVVTTPQQNNKAVKDLDLTQKSALFFGSEEQGVSQEILDNADDIVTIPMHGKTDSFHLSASAGIILHTLIDKLIKNKINYKFSPDELLELRLFWMRKILMSYHIHESRFFGK